MHLFRPTYTVRDPKTGQRVKRQARCWYIEYRDPAAKGRLKKRGRGKKSTDVVRVKGFSDRKATEQLAAKLERELARRKVGLITPDMDQAVRPLAEHLAEFQGYLASKGGTAAHVDVTLKRLAKLADGCGWSRITDVAGDQALQWLRGTLQKADGHGPVTANHYLRALKSFTAWVVGHGRLPIDPMARLRGFRFTEESDLRRVRRALADAEFVRLVTSAAASTAMACGLNGTDRAVLYLVAAYTGLRATALGRLTPECFDLAGELLTVEARWLKSRKKHHVPLHAGLGRHLSTWLAGRPAGAPVWPGGWAESRHGAEMLRFDLAAAGILYQTAEGVFDFHALRSQFVVMLWRAGVDQLSASKLAGHSSPAVTARHYARLGKADLAPEIGRLPPPPALGA